MRARLLLGLMLLVLALSLMGCVPRVELRTARFVGPSPGGVRFDAVMVVKNPNTFAVEVRAVHANVHMEGVSGVVPVHQPLYVYIPPGGRATVVVPVTVPFMMVPQIVSHSVNEPKVNYTVVGRADVFAAGMRMRNYNFEEDGELPRSAFLRVGAGMPLFGLGR